MAAISGPHNFNLNLDPALLPSLPTKNPPDPRGTELLRIRPISMFMESLHGFVSTHWDHETYDSL